MTSFRRWISRWVDGARRRAWLVLAASVLLTTLSGWYAVTRLTIDTDTTDMLSAALPFRQDSIRLDRAFPQLSDNIVIVIDGDTPDQADDAAIALTRALRARPALFGNIFDPRGDAFFRRNGLLFLSEAELNDLVDRLAAAQAFIGKLSQDPSLRGLLSVLTLALDNADKADSGVPQTELDRVLSAIADAIEAERTGSRYLLSWQSLLFGGDATVAQRRRLVVVHPALDYASLQPAKEAMDAIREAAVRLGLTPDAGVRVRLTGTAPLEQEELESVAEGMGLAGLISFTLVLILLFAGLRSARLVGAVLLTLAMGLVWTAAFATLAVGRLNLISVAFAVLFIGLSVDFGIHYVLRMREEMAASGGDGAAMSRAAVDVGGALTLCAVAAAISFFSFLPTSYVGLAELGVIAGSGMFIALFANLTVLPACLGLLPPRVAPAPQEAAGVKQTVSWQIRYAKWIVAGAAVLAVAALAEVPRARFDFDPMDLRDPSTESVATLLDLMGNEDTAPYTADVLAPDRKTADTLTRRLSALPSVESVVSIERFVPANQEDKLAAIDSAAFLLLPSLQKAPVPPPDDRQRKAALQAFRTTVEKHLGPGGASHGARPIDRLDRILRNLDFDKIDLRSLERRLLATLPGRLAALRDSLSAGPVTLDDIPADLRTRYVDARGRLRLEVFPKEDVRDQDQLRRFADEIRSVAPHATGSPVIIVEAGKSVVLAFATAGVISVVLIGLLIIVLLRRIRDVLLVFAPLFLAALLTVAASAVLHMPFNFANVIVLPLLFGLGVASSIHFVLRQRTTDSVASLLDTSTPRAVIYSALTTIGSFASIALSSHPGTASMGVLLTVAITFTLLCTLIVLPALMAVLTGTGRR